MSINRWRQAFHLEPPHGWLNDPNGLCWFGGRYHVFFQYSPESAAGAGEKCWGHYESPDFLHWQFTGIVLRPDTADDCSGVYSGSAVAAKEILHLFYTGNVKMPGSYDYITAGRGSNVLHVTSRDGRQMSPKRCLLRNADYPGCTCHVRDPKVWHSEQGWKMVLGARSTADKGQVLVFHGSDLDHWQYAATITTPEPFGYMWECPDYFRLDGRGVLSVSPQGLPHSALRYQNVYQSGWFSAAGKLEEGHLDAFTEWDRGFDFYAPQTFCAPDGRRILIGWMGLPDIAYQNPTTSLGWQHCLTVPRELSWDKKGRLCQHPVRELQALLGTAQTLSAGSSTAATLPFALSASPEKSFSITLAEGLTLRYNEEEKLCQLCFTDKALGGGRTLRSVQMDCCHDVQILVDRSSLEIYLNGGAVVFSTRFYPKEEEIALQLSGTDAALRPMRAMEVIGFVQ
ncbi:MAG: glycoside hydrolase family 32 protein [Oscillospiraceae bacterium]|jgi:beta-fructofuranosidase|nr:glycoside hydrolase family 32 protein [Oscillospiraceae bacterium]MDD3260636.1 glycoside hydrolase family 32 protein [Oscillospiraceae bacterium]